MEFTPFVFHLSNPFRAKGGAREEGLGMDLEIALVWNPHRISLHFTIV
jgi:hypothetical protein